MELRLGLSWVVLHVVLSNGWSCLHGKQELKLAGPRLVVSARHLTHGLAHQAMSELPMLLRHSLALHGLFDAHVQSLLNSQASTICRGRRSSGWVVSSRPRPRTGTRRRPTCSGLWASSLPRRPPRGLRPKRGQQDVDTDSTTCPGPPQQLPAGNEELANCQAVPCGVLV